MWNYSVFDFFCYFCPILTFLFSLFFLIKSFQEKRYIVSVGILFFTLLLFCIVLDCRLPVIIWKILMAGIPLLLLRIVHILWNAYNTEERQLARQRERENMDAVACLLCFLVGWNPFSDAVFMNIFLLILAVCVIVVCTFC